MEAAAFVAIALTVITAATPRGVCRIRRTDSREVRRSKSRC